MLEIILFLFASFLSAIAATLAGFGSSTIMVPIAFFFMDPKTAIFIVACFHLFNNIFKVKYFGKDIDFSLVLWFGIPSILFSFIGAMLFGNVSSTLIARVAGYFIICLSLKSLFLKNIEIKNSKSNSVVGGVLSGFLAGLIGLGGALRAVFLTSYKIPKNVYIATSALIAMFIDITRIPAYWFSYKGYDSAFLKLLPVLFIIAYLGVKVGKIIVNKVDQILFQKIVSIALFLVGLKLILN